MRATLGLLELVYISPLAARDFPGLFLEASLLLSTCALLQEEASFHLNSKGLPYTFLGGNGRKKLEKPKQGSLSLRAAGRGLNGIEEYGSAC